MANALYSAGREGFLDGSIDWDTATIKAALVRGYTFSAAHRFVHPDVGSTNLVATSAALSSKTVTSGTADAADVTFTAVAAGAAITGILVFQASLPTGGGDVANTAQRVIAYIDTATNLPVTPNGGDVTIAWDNTANRIFTL